MELKIRSWFGFTKHWIINSAPLIYKMGRKGGRSHINCLYGCYLHYQMAAAAHKFLKT